MQNRTINIGVVAKVAEALGELKEKMVFVGGAVVSLYTDDPAADEVRPTQDIDMTLNIIHPSDWYQLEDELADLGFHPDPSGKAICSYRYEDNPVDIMPAEDGSRGPTNRWYKPAFDNLWKATVKDQEINILSAPYYLATKFEAFKNRGSDYRTSHDIEDIIYVVDNRTTIVQEISESPMDVREFIQSNLKQIIEKDLLSEVLMAHIHPLIIEDRLPMVEEKIHAILKS